MQGKTINKRDSQISLTKSIQSSKSKTPKRDFRNSVFGIRHAQTEYTEDFYNGNSLELMDAVLSKKGVE